MLVRIILDVVLRDVHVLTIYRESILNVCGGGGPACEVIVLESLDAERKFPHCYVEWPR